MYLVYTTRVCKCNVYTGHVNVLVGSRKFLQSVGVT